MVIVICQLGYVIVITDILENNVNVISSQVFKKWDRWNIFFSSSDIFCLNNCSGNGECNQETGICNCGESYSGSDCSCNYNIPSVFYEFWPVEVFYDKKNFFWSQKMS